MRIFNFVPFAIRGPHAALILLFLLSLGPPVFYYHAIGPALNSARLATGFVPEPFISLWIFGFSSLFIPAIIALCVAVAFWRRASSQALLRWSVVVVLLFNTCYLCTALSLITVALILR